MTESRAEDGCVVHAAAASADELLAIGEDGHEFVEGGVDGVGAEDGEGDRDQERGGGGEAGRRWEVAVYGGVDALEDTPLAGDGLRGGAEVVLPIAAGDGGEG